MLKQAKKRTAEKAPPSDEPIKKKPNKLDAKQISPAAEQKKPGQLVKKPRPVGAVDGDGNKKTFSKGPKAKFSPKKSFWKPGAGGGSKGKFDGKKFEGKKFDGKKFEGKKFDGKKFEGKKFDGKKFEGKKFGAKAEGADEKNGDAPSEKTDWRKFKQDKKDLKVKRKQSKDSYDISIEAKQIYEKLKCRRTEKKNELVEKLYNLLSAGDTIKKLVMAHDTARIIQCMLKHAAPALREQLSEKLLPLAVSMAVSKYSHFCVLRMFKYGSPGIKSKLVDTFFGNVVRLACHNISSKILDHVYLSVANAKQKIHMRQEFYGELYRSSKDDSVTQLADTYKEAPTMKASILGSVKSNLEHVANKELVDNSLVHAVMLEYVRECEEDKMEEVVTMFATLIPLMLSTKDGCQAAIICFYKATPKNRRAIIKTIKEHLVKICNHEHGHIFVLAVLNALDDTKATKKAIYDTIHPELQALMANQWGRRVVEWLVSPGDTNCFHPTFIASMEEGLKYGKKDKDVRRREIFEQIEAPIATAIAEQPAFWLSDRHIVLVTAEILKNLSNEHFLPAASALASIIVKPTWTVTVEDESTKEKKGKKTHDVEKIIAAATKQRKELQKKAAKIVEAPPTKSDEGEGEGDANVDKANSDDEDDEEEKSAPEVVATSSVAGIEDAGLHIVLKKIIKNDKERLSKQTDANTFGTILVQQLTDDTLKYWLGVNRACFVLLNIVENNNAATTEQLKTLLAPHLALLKEQAASGAKLLHKKLAF